MNSGTIATPELQADGVKSQSDSRTTARITANVARAPELSHTSFLCATGLIAILLWCAVWAYVAAFPMAYLDRNYPLAQAKRQLAAECLPERVIVFGDSRAVAAIDPKFMSLQVVNLAYPGASPVENYFLVRKALDCGTPPKLVVLDQSAALYVGPHAFWDIFAHTGILSTTEMREVTEAASRLHDENLKQMPHPGGVPYSLLPELYGIRFPPLYFGNLVGGYGFARYRYNLGQMHDIVAASGHTLFGDASGSDEVSDEGLMTSWEATPLTTYYLTRTLALLRSRHIPVAIVTMPVNQATCSHMHPNIQTAFSNYLRKVSSAPNIILSDSQMTCWPDRDFNDNAHFNSAGAKAYSIALDRLLKTALSPMPSRADQNG